MRVYCEKFESTFKSWEALFEEAYDFATQLAPEQIISISHSCDSGTGVVAVWY